MRSFIINTLKISVLTALITTSAIAASMPSPQKTNTFSGFFTGFDMGAGVAQTSISHTRSAVASVVPNLNNVNGSMAIGLLLGYGHNWNKFYLGGIISGEKLFGSYTTQEGFSGIFSFTHNHKVTTHFNALLTPGYVASPNVLLFASLGAGALQLHDSVSTEFGPQIDPTVTLNKWVFGPAVGGGVRFKITPHIVFGLNMTVDFYPKTVEKTVAPNTIKMKVSHYFGTMFNLSYLF